MSNDHFVDTNVVIGYTVNWDRQYPPIQGYVSTVRGQISLHTSDRVLSEAEKVVNDRRQLAQQAARRVFTGLSGSSPIPDDRIINFVRSELNSQPDGPVDHVLQYIQNNISPFKGLVESNNQIVLDRTTTDIHRDFGQPTALIDDIRREVHADLQVSVHRWGSPDYSTVYSEYGSLKSLLPDAPIDRDILCDAHHLTVQNGINPLGFVSMDRRDILDNKVQIESLFPDLDIVHPGNI